MIFNTTIAESASAYADTAYQLDVGYHFRQDVTAGCKLLVITSMAITIAAAPFLSLASVCLGCLLAMKLKKINQGDQPSFRFLGNLAMLQMDTLTKFDSSRDFSSKLGMEIGLLVGSLWLPSVSALLLGQRFGVALIDKSYRQSFLYSSYPDKSWRTT